MMSEMTESKDITTPQDICSDLSEMQRTQLIGKNWVTKYTEHDFIRKLLGRCGLWNYNFSKIDRIFQIDTHRIAMIVHVIEIQSQKSEQLIIDVTNKEPDWQQMMDVTYGIGADCDIKIIVWDNENPNFCYADTLVSNFINYLNKNGYPTFLIASKVGENGNKIEIVEEGLMYRKGCGDGLPSRLEMHKTEFVHYFCTVSGIEPPVCQHDRYMIILGDGDWPAEFHCFAACDGDLSVAYPIWNEDGVFMRITAETESGKEKLDFILKLGSYALKMYVGRLKMEMTVADKKTKQLLIKVWDVPFSEFIASDVNRRIELAKHISQLEPKLEAF